jgi:hypothetical protein
VTELADRSLTFRAWWAEHDVHVLEPARKRILHQTYGLLDLLQMQPRPTHRSSLQLRILAPADDVTRAALEVIDAARRGTDPVRTILRTGAGAAQQKPDPPPLGPAADRSHGSRELLNPPTTALQVRRATQTELSPA